MNYWRVFQRAVMKMIVTLMMPMLRKARMSLVVMERMGYSRLKR